jgi:hypothetical protein
MIGGFNFIGCRATPSPMLGPAACRVASMTGLELAYRVGSMTDLSVASCDVASMSVLEVAHCDASSMPGPELASCEVASMPATVGLPEQASHMNSSSCGALPRMVSRPS